MRYAQIAGLSTDSKIAIAYSLACVGRPLPQVEFELNAENGQKRDIYQIFKFARPCTHPFLDQSQVRQWPHCVLYHTKCHPNRYILYRRPRPKNRQKPLKKRDLPRFQVWEIHNPPTPKVMGGDVFARVGRYIGRLCL